MDKLYNFQTDVLHENESYAVYGVSVDITANDVFILDNMGCAYAEGYALVNKQTGQVELVRATLPDLLYNAEHLNEVLTSKGHMWVREAHKAVAVIAPTDETVN